MPFTCLNCDEKIVKLRDLARLGCRCLRPFYHFHCLAALPVNLCMKCNKRAHTLRGIKAIWDSFTHDEWKSSLDLDLLKGVNRSYVIELMDSMLLDWVDTSNSNGSEVSMPPNSLNFLVCDYWKVFDLLEGSTNAINPTNATNPREPIEPTDPTNPIEPTDPTNPTNPIEPIDPIETTDSIEPIEPRDPIKPTDIGENINENDELVRFRSLILDRLEDALRIYPLEDRVILGSKKGIRRLSKDPNITNHADFLKKLWIYTQGVINPHLLNWIKEDMIRNQSIFFTGPLIFDILYGAFLNNKDSKKLIIQILGLDDVSIKKLLGGLLDKIIEGFTYIECISCATSGSGDGTYNADDKNTGSEAGARTIRSMTATPDIFKEVLGRKCYIQNLGQNRLKLSVEGISQQIEIHLFRSNDIRKIMISNKAGSIPYQGDGLLVSPSGLWTTLRWLYSVREKTIVSEGNYKVPRNLHKDKNDKNLKQIIDIDAIKHGFLLCTDLSRLCREFGEPYTDYEDLDEDIEEKFIPDTCMRITIDNLWDYMQKPKQLKADTEIELETDLETVGVEHPFFPEETIKEDDKDGRLYLYTNDRLRNEELIANLIKRVTYNKKSNILDSLPNPYMPQRRY